MRTLCGRLGSAQDHGRKRRVTEPERALSDSVTVEQAVAVHIQDPEAVAKNAHLGFAGTGPVGGDRNITSLAEKGRLIDARGPHAVTVGVEIPGAVEKEAGLGATGATPIADDGLV